MNQEKAGPQSISLICSNCSKEFSAEAELVVLPESPALDALQQGTLNSALCPWCGQNGILALPFVLYQPEFSRAICFIPQATRLPEAEKQAIVNELGRWLKLAVGENELPEGYSLETGISADYDALVKLAREGSLVEEERLKARLQILERLLKTPPGERAELLAEYRGPMEELAVLSRQVAEQALATGNPLVASSLRNLAQELESSGKPV